MDESFLKLAGEVLAHGGNAGILVALYFLYRASETATKAVEALRSIRDNQKTQAERFERMETKLERVHEDVREVPFKVAGVRR